MAWFNSHDQIRTNTSNFIDQTDAYANNHKTFISFLHIPSSNEVYFKAMITTFSDSFSSQWSGEEVYGRADPIQIFKSTKRSITLGFDVVASTDQEAWQNLSRVETLARFLYPAYTDVSQAQTVAQSPLVRVGFMNMITDGSKGISLQDSQAQSRDGTSTPRSYDNRAENGLVCAITSLNYSSFGFEKDNSNSVVAKGSILPRVINVSLSLEPIHSHALGWNGKNFAQLSDPDGNGHEVSFPYGEHNPSYMHGGGNRKVDTPSYKNRTHKATYTNVDEIQKGRKATGKGGDVKPPALSIQQDEFKYGYFDSPTGDNPSESRYAPEVQNLESGMKRLNNTFIDLNIRQTELQRTQQQIDMANARYNSLGGRFRKSKDEKFNPKTPYDRTIGYSELHKGILQSRYNLSEAYDNQETRLSDASKPIDPRGSLDNE